MRKQIFTSWVVAVAVALGGAAGVMAQGSDKAAEVLGAAHSAIGGTGIERLKTLSVQAAVTRNVGEMQMNSDVELLLEMPGKYLRTESGSGPMTFSSQTGFNGDRPVRTPGAMTPGGGHMMIRMGPGGALPAEKPTPEQQADMDRMSLRAARQDIARLTLGWFGAAHPAVKAEYTYAGEAEAADGKADVIDVKGEDGFAARLFIDKATHLPLMLTYQGPKRMIMTGRPGGQRVVQTTAPTRGQAAPANEEERRKGADAAKEQVEALRRQPLTLVEYRLYFSDWSEVDGIKFPLKIQRATEGTPEEEWTITKVRVNPKIDPKKFEVQQ
jgi:hypothetical protein